MKYFIEVMADTNDADYISEISEISIDDLNRLRPYFEKIMEPVHKRKEYYSLPVEEKTSELSKQFNDDLYYHNWPDSEYQEETLIDRWPDISEDILNEISRFVPYGEYGVHSIDRIRVFTVTNVEIL